MLTRRTATTMPLTGMPAMRTPATSLKGKAATTGPCLLILIMITALRMQAIITTALLAMCIWNARLPSASRLTWFSS